MYRVIFICVAISIRLGSSKHAMYVWSLTVEFFKKFEVYSAMPIIEMNDLT